MRYLSNCTSLFCSCMLWVLNRALRAPCHAEDSFLLPLMTVLYDTQQFSKKNQIGQILSSYVGYDPLFATKISILSDFGFVGCDCTCSYVLFCKSGLPIRRNPLKIYLSVKISDICLILHPCKPKKAKGSLVCRNWHNVSPARFTPFQIP